MKTNLRAEREKEITKINISHNYLCKIQMSGKFPQSFQTHIPCSLFGMKAVTKDLLTASVPKATSRVFLGINQYSFFDLFNLLSILPCAYWQCMLMIRKSHPFKNVNSSTCKVFQIFIKVHVYTHIYFYQIITVYPICLIFSRNKRLQILFKSLFIPLPP